MLIIDSEQVRAEEIRVLYRQSERYMTRVREGCRDSHKLPGYRSYHQRSFTRLGARNELYSPLVVHDSQSSRARCQVPGGRAKKELRPGCFPSEPPFIAHRAGAAANIPKFPRRHRSNTTDNPPSLFNPQSHLVLPRLQLCAHDSTNTNHIHPSEPIMSSVRPPSDTTSPFLRHARCRPTPHTRACH